MDNDRIERIESYIKNLKITFDDLFFKEEILFKVKNKLIGENLLTLVVSFGKKIDF